MKTIYFLNETGGMKYLPCSQKDAERYKSWLKRRGYREVTMKEYREQAKKFERKATLIN